MSRVISSPLSLGLGFPGLSCLQLSSRRMTVTFRSIALALITGLTLTTLSAQPVQACGGDANSYFQIKSVTKVRDVAGRVDWSKALDLIAYDSNRDGVFQVYVMSPDGLTDRCITCNRT